MSLYNHFLIPYYIHALCMDGIGIYASPNIEHEVHAIESSQRYLTIVGGHDVKHSVDYVSGYLVAIDV